MWLAGSGAASHERARKGLATGQSHFTAERKRNDCTNTARQAHRYLDLLIERGLADMIETGATEKAIHRECDPEQILDDIEDPTGRTTPGEEYASSFLTAVEELWSHCIPSDEFLIGRARV
jgi:hypothetical protein